MRNGLSVLSGIVVAVIVIFIMEAASNMFFPPPKGLDMENPEDVRKLIANAPAGSLIIVLIGWAFGAFCRGNCCCSNCCKK